MRFRCHATKSKVGFAVKIHYYRPVMCTGESIGCEVDGKRRLLKMPRSWLAKKDHLLVLKLKVQGLLFRCLKRL
ncbi:hypothetical protein LINGRAHAP2_LOCUS4787 [Linum grandiflorum]